MLHLHVHSHYSLLEGTAGVRQLVARAVEHGIEALALTDSEGLYGAIPFYKAARAAGIRPLIGARVGPVVALARDREGYAQVCELVTAYHVPPAEMDPPVDGAAFWRRALAEEALPWALDRVLLLSADRDVLRALHRLGHAPLVAVSHTGGRRSWHQADQQVAFARAHGLRPVAVNPVYFLDPDHYRMHQALCAMRLNTTLGALRPEDTAPPEAWFRSPREMDQLFRSWPETLDNLAWVAEACELDLPLGTPRFPDFPLPAGETPFSWLWKQTFEGVRKRYQPLTPEVINRVRYELETIHQLGFAPYFLIVADIVAHARSHAIPIVGRGSAANSVVAYALGITRVDPFQYNLYFERFLNPGRTDAPDIDLDICWRRRDDVIDYVYERYGADRVAMICTLNTFRARAAIREVAKVHGLMDHEITGITRRMPRYGVQDLDRIVETVPECRGLSFRDEPLKSILEISKFIDGFPRHLSIHAGGVVIAPEKLTHFTPLQEATKGIIITQYDMHPVEDLGLIKMDLLGHRSLTVIDDTVKAVRANRGIDIDPERLPDPDPLTGEMLRAGRTMGCFQIESPAMRGLLQKVHADSTHTLIQTVALVRPGASGSGMKKHFIDRHHGREAVSHLHPKLEAVLGDTYGVMIYQEDVLKVAHAIAGMNLAEADALRRAMSKARSPRKMAQNRDRFLEGARENGVDEETAGQIWELIANFAAYSYCKAHAATYGELAYQCAYLKAHFTTEFFASVLSNRGGFYHPAAYLEEAKRCGVSVLPPDVNRSHYDYVAEGDALRVGFVEVRHLSQNAIRRILDARAAGGRIRDLADLRDRAGVARSDVEALLHAGALDSLGAPRPVLLWQMQLLYQGKPRKQAETSASLFSEAENNLATPRLPDYSSKKRTDQEWESLGMITRGHPLQYYLAGLQEAPIMRSMDLPRHRGEMVTLAGWLVTERRLSTQDGGGSMKFMTLEDTTGSFECVLFPRVYQTFGHLLTSHGPFLVTGEAQEEADSLALIVSHVMRIDQHNNHTPRDIDRILRDLHQSPRSAVPHQLLRDET
jgi:DNA-directed DNA polymerase III PolC